LCLSFKKIQQLAKERIVLMTENSKGQSLQIGELLENISGTAVKIFGFVAGSVGLLYAIGFTIVNLSLLRHGVYEVGLVRARFISAGVSYLVLVSLLAGIVWTCLYLIDLWSERWKSPEWKSQSWLTLLISLIPISLLCLFLAMAVWGFKAISERDITGFNIPFLVWCLAFSVFLLFIMGSDRIPKVKDLRTILETNETGVQKSLGERFSAIGVWSIIVVLLIVILYFYGQNVYQTFPSALGGGQPIVIQFTGEESSLATLGQVGITQLEPGLTDKVELIAQTENNYIVLVYDPVLKTDVAISFDKSFTKGIKYYPDEHYLSSEYRKEKYTSEGMKYIEEKDFETADEWFDKALILDDTYIPALLGKGNAIIESPNPDKAVTYFKLALELENDLASAHYGLARAYTKDKQFGAAIDSLKQAFILDETLLETAKTDKIFYVDNELIKEIFQGYENAAIWFGQEGDILREAGDLDGSIEKYEKARSLSQAAGDKNSEADYRYRLSEVYMLKKNVKDARDQINQAIILAPENTVYLLGLAKVYAVQAEFEKAREQYQSVIDIKPDDLAARSGLGEVYLELENYPEAESQYRAVIEKDPSYASGYYGLARAKAIQGYTAEATFFYRRAVSLYPAYREESENDKFLKSILNEIVNLNTAADKNNLGNQLLTDGKIEQAIDEFNKAVSLDPSNAKFHANLGRAYKQQGRLADAEAALGNALSNAPEEDQYYFLLGEVKFEQGDLESAIDNYAKALGLDSENPKYHARIAEAYALGGDLQAALSEYEIAIDLDQINPVYHFQFARALADYGEPEEAIPYFVDVLSRYPDYSDAFCGLAMAHQDAGHTEDAQDNLAKCVELSTNELLVNEAQQKFQD
jgi:tetratricopeptide (TPR) repeat protein